MGYASSEHQVDRLLITTPLISLGDTTLKKFSLSATIPVFVVVAAMLVMMAPETNAVTIDDFTQTADQQVLISGIGGPTSITQALIPAVNTIGTSRELKLQVVGSSSGGDSKLKANIAFNVANYANDPGNSSIGKLIYDANGFGLGGVDVTDSGASQFFQAVILTSDVNAGFQVEITETAVAGGQTATFATSLGAGASFISQLLTSFTNGGIVDFTQVNKIVITLTGPEAQDTTIQLLETTGTPGVVPEPSTYALGIIGLSGIAGFAMIRRRRSAA